MVRIIRQGVNGSNPSTHSRRPKGPGLGPRPPWATPGLVVRNRSHGCPNLSSGSAKWFYTKSIVGDPVITKGTPRDMEPFNGLGAPYNLSWKDWLAKSVLKGAW